jgi:hypothetical protein
VHCTLDGVPVCKVCNAWVEQTFPEHKPTANSWLNALIQAVGPYAGGWFTIVGHDSY